MSEIRSLAVHAAEILNKFKGNDIVVLDVANATVITEYMVIATARTAQHVKALCDDVEDKLAEEGILPRKKEGQTEGRWAILDYGGVLVHVFHPEERQYYRLERLWDDGLNRVELTFDNSAEEKNFLE